MIKRHLRGYLLVTVLQLGFARYAQSQGIAQYEERFAELAKSEGVIGFGVAIVTADSVLYTGGFGYADIETERPYTSQTVQPLASISKTLLGMSFMKLQELGKLTLDEGINTHLPFDIIHPNYPNESITLRHLATHTSSLLDTKHYRKSYVFAEEIPKVEKELPPGDKRTALKRMRKQYNGHQELPLEQFLQSIYTPTGKWYSKESFTEGGPGTEYQYSNNGAALASMIIEQAGGMPYEAFVQQYILDPLGMEDSGWDMRDYALGDRATLYAAGLPIPTYRLITLADGGFVTHIDDFARYMQASILGYRSGNQLLTKASYAEMMSPQPGNSNSGIFWQLNPPNIGHSGGDPGIRTHAFFHRDLLKSSVIFMNASELEGQSEVVDQLFELMDAYYEQHLQRTK